MLVCFLSSDGGVVSNWCFLCIIFALLFMLFFAREGKVIVFINPEKSKRRVNNKYDKFRLSLGTTIRCRYNASVRIANQGMFSFWTTVILSLGLIVIPLMEGAGFELSFSEGEISVFQIFLAISILVYSLSIALLQYDLRSYKMDCCADELKKLARDFDGFFGTELGGIGDSKNKRNKLLEFQDRYSIIMNSGENHSRNDFRRAVIDMPSDYNLCWVGRLVLRLKAWFFSFLLYILPASLILVEFVFILDMIGVTRLFRGLLGNGLTNTV